MRKRFAIPCHCEAGIRQPADGGRSNPVRQRFESRDCFAPLAMTGLLFCASLFTPSNLPAQDIHFSQYMTTPLHNSPALTGLFEGDFRLGANYRSQWGSVTVPYRTFAASGDMLIANGLLDGDLVGAGLWLYSDRAGDIAFGTNEAMLSLAYHKRLSEYGTHFLSAGFQAGIAQRGFDASKVTLDNQFADFGMSITIPPNESFGKSSIIYPDVAAGVSWLLAPTARSSIYAGAGFFHLNTPNQSFMSDVVPMDIRQTVFAGGSFALSGRMSLYPRAIAHLQGAHTEYSFGTYLGLHMNHTVSVHETTLAFGVSSRWNDAVIFGVMLNHDALGIGVSYDLNMSELAVASTARGGPEMALGYMIDRGRHRLEGTVGNCPRF